MPILEAINISQNFDSRTILRNINIKFYRGDIFALIGPTGAGKTTLLRILDLIDMPYSGSLIFDGTDMRINRKLHMEARRRMSYVYQKPIAFNISVFDNVAIGLRWRHEKTKVIIGKVEHALELVGMEDYRNRNARTLSGGETQLVAIARAIVTNPEVLFLDEPTANMDPVTTQKIESALTHFIRENKITVIMSTHDMPQGHRLANRVGVIINGELRQTGTPNAIFNEPESKEVAEFVGIQNILSGEISRKEGDITIVKINGVEISAISDFLVGDNIYALIRPESVVFALSKEVTSARNIFHCRVNRINTVGHIVRIEVDCGFPLTGVVTRQAAQELNIAIGSSLYASIKATAVNIIQR